ncbi:branched-chain amino acid ABC transporter permease [uncultured Maritimibacter sp.]|jgi:branched-chain amino acid transport system permease protein|uniref:branched-chain amino acid ABC transporter permease n=1 Tax=uncultured Maritimibacter sp. TaxID=991866 RepID=UPI002626537D|nr:branched-chain amino acid ABC transporter permease [uncultured Maritimibacter sp.]
MPDAFLPELLQPLVQALVQGTLLGGYYAIMAVGLSLMVGVVRFINLAHGDMAVLGALLVITLTQGLGLPIFAAILIMLPVMALAGYGMHALLFERAMRGGFLLPILVTIGLGAALQNSMFGLWGSNTRSLGADIGALSWASWTLPGGVLVGQLPVLVCLCAVLVIGSLHLVLRHTRLGRAIKATSTDAEAAELCGVDARRARRAASAIAVGLAALAGVFLAMRGQITPYSGPAQLIFAFEAVVIGGLGSVWGTLVGGIVLGISQSLGGLVSNQASLLTGHLVFLAVLLLRLFREWTAAHGGWRASVRAWTTLHRGRFARRKGEKA